MIGRVNIEKFTMEEIKNLELVKNGSIGFNSIVYRLNDKECVKIFRKNVKTNCVYGVYKTSKFMKCSFETAEMPKRLAIVDNRYSGYVLNYINGPMLEECADYDFSEMLLLYSKFIEKATIEISDEGILIIDSNAYNILLDEKEKKLKLIDSDSWIIKNKKMALELKGKNFKTLAQTFSCFAFSSLFCDLDINGDFIDYFESRRKELQKEKHVKIKTISDIRKI